MSHYILSPEAREDLRNIRDYLANEAGKAVAKYVLQEITLAFRLLASNPQAGHLRQDLTSHAVKFWPVFSYLIVYDPAGGPLSIVRVFHSHQDVEKILRRAPPRL